MRIFVTLENTPRRVDVQPEVDVKTLKDIVESKLLVDTHDDKKEGKILDLIYGGASLEDDWVLQDIGINSGTTIKCELKLQVKSKLRVILRYSSDELLEIFDLIDPLTSTIGQIKTIVSKELGLPVSAYRLCLLNPPDRANPKLMGMRVDKAVELFDCNTLESYGIEIGDTIKLEVWDGWSEFIRMALIGHDKLVGQYLSYREAERRFQRRVALHIAAHFDYTDLASAMLRVGTRPDQAVGAHPTREWCNESDHIETKKCAVHEASEMGNLNVLRMLMKANVLCFAAKDGKGRTAWQIVVEHFHKDCFEYLLARQWGRKSGKDNISLPIVIYCRVMQWCERARNRVFRMHGASKSTLRGKPTSAGALVGNGVAVDGLGNKAMSSIPLSAMPKPVVHPKRMIPALAKARRRFKRDKSSGPFNIHARGRLNSISRQSSRFTILSRNSNSTVATDHSSNSASQVLTSDDTQSHKNEMKPSLKKPNAKGRERESFRLASDTESLRSDWGKDSLPPIRPLGVAEQRKGRKHGEEMEGASSLKTALMHQARSRDLSALSITSNGPKTTTVNGGTKGKGIPLPFNRIPEFRKPYMYWGSAEDPIEITLSRFESYRGTSARDNAIRCLSLTDAFTKKSFLKRANMAACLAKRGVTKNTALIS